MATGRVPTTANSPLTAKGDLFGYSTTQARVPVGSDGETLVADSSASTGLRWEAKQQAGCNLLLNSDFGIWQRGTSFTGASPYYGADRWQFYRSGAVSGATFTRQTASLDGFDYCTRVQRDSGNTGTQFVRVATSFETTQVKSLWGKPLTLSFYARAGANISSTDSKVQAIIHGGTGTDGSLAAGFTSRVSLISTGIAITSTWARYSVSISALSNTYTQLGVSVELQPTGTAGAADYFEITGIQLETGNVATPFTTATGTLAGELAACMRYYQKSFAQGTAPANDTTGSTAGGVTGWIAYTANDVRSPFIVFPVTMRTSASVTLYNTTDITDDGYWAYYTGSAWAKAASALGQQTVTASESGFYVSGNNVGAYTQHRPYLLAGNWAASAEL